MRPWRRTARVLANPIVEREALSRSRSRALSSAVVLSLVLLAAIAAWLFSRAASIPAVARGGDFALAAYQTAAFQIVIAALGAAALAAGTISGERAGRTFDMLMVSGLGSWTIVRAKLVASVSYVAFVVVASLPVLAAVFFHAGLGVRELALAELVTLATAIGVVSISVFLSALCPRTLTAAMATFSLVFALFVDTLTSGLVPPLGSVRHEATTFVGGTATPIAVAVVHPVRLANPWYAVHQVVTARDRPGVPVGQMTRALLGGRRASAWGLRMQPWQVSVLVQVGLSALFLGAAAGLVSGVSWPSWAKIGTKAVPAA